MDRWKASEFRQFLLYRRRYALRGVLSNNACEHFISIFVAITSLEYEDFVLHYATHAHRLLCYFVTLLQIAADCTERFLCLQCACIVALKVWCWYTWLIREMCFLAFWKLYATVKTESTRRQQSSAAQKVKRIFESMETDVIPTYI